MIPISELDLIKIGEIVKAHGYKGELVIKFFSNFYDLDKTEPIFIEIDGTLVPFFFSNSPRSLKKLSVIAKFNTINSDQEVKGIMKCEVYSQKCDIDIKEEDVFETIEGYDVFDNKKLIGKAGKYLNIPSNPILTVIDVSKNEVLIPVNDKFLIEINKDNKFIIFNLPKGLVDVNL